MRKSMMKTGLRWLWITLIVIAFDRLTKSLALAHLQYYNAKAIIPGFNLALSFNKGAAFSFLNSANGWQTIFFGTIAILATLGILFWLWRLSFKERAECIALCLIAGGALGNLLDRILYGHVIDFIQLYISHFYWPTFNIADSAICIGAVLLFGSKYFQEKEGVR